MKRKGFTLVELLIVIAIIGTLTAITSISTGRATASAKAATILSNIESCKTAAAVYYSENYDTDLSEITAKAFLDDNPVYLPGWTNMSKGNIKYAADENSKGYENWSITVTFSSESDKAGIKAALENAKSASGLTISDGSVTAKLTYGGSTTDDDGDGDGDGDGNG